MDMKENIFPLLEDVVDVRLRMVPDEGNDYTLILPVDLLQSGQYTFLSAPQYSP